MFLIDNDTPDGDKGIGFGPSHGTGSGSFYGGDRIGTSDGGSSGDGFGWGDGNDYHRGGNGSGKGSGRGAYDHAEEND